MVFRPAHMDWASSLFSRLPFLQPEDIEHEHALTGKLDQYRRVDTVGKDEYGSGTRKKKKKKKTD